MARQYVAAKFRVEDKRTYTYHNDGDPVKPGDRVKVEDRSGDGWKAVHVAEVSYAAPPFATKPVLGLAPAELPASGGKALVIGGGAIVPGFLWRTREGEMVSPGDMETRHLFYTLRMIWNCHAPEAERVGRNVKLYSFGPSYTRAYFEEAIANLAANLLRRDDIAPWQMAELEQMAAHTARRSPLRLV